MNEIQLDNTECDKFSQLQSFREVKEKKENFAWNYLADFLVIDEINCWLKTLSKHTQRAYESGFKRLNLFYFIDFGMSLQSFSFVNHEAVIDKIKKVEQWSEATRQARASCYIAFTAYLERKYKEIFRKSIPNRDSCNKTFYKIREKAKTNAMTREEWEGFLVALENLSMRDALIAKIILQGAKRIGEVLSLHDENINWTNSAISFQQLKTGGTQKETVITYPEKIMRQLKAYLGDRSGLVFVKKNGEPINAENLSKVFAKAGYSAKIQFRVTPHTLRASAVTYLKKHGFADSDIMKVTGHSSASMINYYDKSEISDNASKKISLI